MASNFKTAALTVWVLLILCPLPAQAQTQGLPKEIRGYKVEHAVVEVKKQKKPSDKTAGQQTGSELDTNALIGFGDAQVAGLSPLGISLVIPMVVAPVEQKGRVDFLVFEDMVVNGTSVQIDEYQRSFELPNKEPLTLPNPVKFYIYLPSVVLAAIDEWGNSKDRWLVTGRVYVFGKFKKSFVSFKRCIPVELNFTMRNPLREP
jgi:hypothetical protein